MPKVLKMKMSRKMSGSTPGRCTLTATSSPVSRSTALYTWPREAAAMGLSEMEANTSPRGRPREASISEKAWRAGGGQAMRRWLAARGLMRHV